MNKTIFALAAVATLSALPSISYAEDPPPDPLSFNIGVVSDYRFRGISQSRLKPALQGGADYAFASGFYIGTWASTINWIHDAGTIAGIDTGRGPVEIDIYGGYKGEIAKDFTYDIGALQYYYPSQHLNNIPNNYSPNTLELYGALTYGPATVKYSGSVTRLFGFQSSKGSGYLEAAATLDVGGGFSVTPHIGYQKVRHNSDFSYTDYSVTGAHDWFGLTFTAAVVGTSTKNIAGTPAYVSPSGKNLGRTTLVVGVKKTF